MSLHIFFNFSILFCALSICSLALETSFLWIFLILLEHSLTISLEIANDCSRISFNLSNEMDKLFKLESNSDNYTACFKYSTFWSSSDSSSR